MMGEINGNYVEIYMYSNQMDDEAYDISFPEERFFTCMKNILNKYHIRYNEYNVRETVVNNLFLRSVLEVDKNKQEQYKQQLQQHNLVGYANDQKNKTVTFVYNRENAPLHSYPSSQQVFKDMYISYRSLRVSKNLFLNFEKQFPISDIKKDPTYVVKFAVWNHPLADDQIRDIKNIILELQGPIC